MIVGAHDDEHIFDRHDQRHGPEDQRQNTVDVDGIDRERMMADETFLQCIERGCTDVAEHDPQGAKSQRR
jgi:hypothetical protein